MARGIPPFGWRETFTIHKHNTKKKKAAHDTKHKKKAETYKQTKTKREGGCSRTRNGVNNNNNRKKAKASSTTKTQILYIVFKK